MLSGFDNWKLWKGYKGHNIKHGAFSKNMGLSFYTYDNRDNYDKGRKNKAGIDKMNSKRIFKDQRIALFKHMRI